MDSSRITSYGLHRGPRGGLAATVSSPLTSPGPFHIHTQLLMKTNVCAGVGWTGAEQGPAGLCGVWHDE
jgi:hypothetical protein